MFDQNGKSVDITKPNHCQYQHSAALLFHLVFYAVTELVETRG